jgi:hypothetical protein
VIRALANSHGKQSLRLAELLALSLPSMSANWRSSFCMVVPNYPLWGLKRQQPIAY